MRLESVYTQHHPNFGEGRVYADHGYVHYGVDSRRSRIFIHNIQVDAAHRGQGIGTALLDAVANQYPDHDMDLGYTTDDGEALWQSWLRKRATVEDALVHPHGDLERHMREDHGYADDEFGPIGYYRDKGPAAMAAWHESEHREQKRVENQGSRFRPGVMTPHTHNPGIQSVNQKTAVINEDGEYSEPLEPHERRYDPEVHKFEDNREFDTSKRMTSIPKHLCNSCGVEAKYVRGLCHDCWHNHGASFEAQPTGMWETDSGDTQERLRDALHPKGLDEYGRGWVNYTPDRGVKHSENSVQREQLHEIAKPKHVDTWGKSDEEKGQARQQSEHDYNDFWSRVKRAAGISDDEPAHTLHHVWQTGMQRAMANGTISVDQAEERGYHGDAREHGEKTHDWENNRDVRRGGYQPLPQHTFHTTTNLSAVQSEGLKTPEELAHKGGHGLGGGAGNTISVTTDHSLAHDIYHSLHERHAFLNGKIGWDDLIDNHHGGADPQKIRDSIDSSHTPSQVDRYKRGVVSGVGDNAPGLSTKEEAAKTHPEWSVSPNYPKDCAIETGKGTMYPSHAWERPATPEEHMEHRESYYKSFSWMRGTHGGHRDPLFMSTNPHEFAKKDPNEFAVTTITHNGNAHAFPLRQDGAHHNNADSGEWRTHSGENLRLSSWERPVPRHEIEQGLHKEGATDFIPGQGQLFDNDHSNHLPNPVEGGHDWHHGTPKDLLSLKQEHPEPDDDDGDYEEESRRHWNSYLGDHWTSMRGVGEMFARGGYHHSNDSDKGEGNVFTANLGIKNPKVYGAEARMDSEAVRHAWDQADPHDPSGVHAEHCNHDRCYDYQQHFEDHGDDRAGKRVRGHYEDPAFAADWLNSHPEKWNIADHFKRHLQSQGHDGVVYGNQVEGPSNHPCAITFNHDQVHNLRRSGMTGAPDHGGLFSRPHKPMEWIGEMHDRMGEPYDRHQRAFEEMRNKTASTDDDYHIDHRPADADGAPAHDLTKVYPDDVYSHSHYYGTGDDEHDAQSWSQVHRVKGRPDAKVRIYRSMPAEHVHKGIQPGDWVTTSKSYARQHGTHATDKNQDWPVIRAHVRADEIHTNGDSINEWGYNGDRPRQGMISYKGGHDQEVSHRADGTIRPVQRRQAAYTPKDIKVKLHHPRVGEYEQHRQVPRDEDGNPPERAYRWAHHEQVKGYQADGVPKGTYFSTEPDDRYRASDHALVSVPYSDEHFRSSMNLSGEHYLSTEATIPAEHVTVHHDKTAARVYRGERPDTGQRIYGDLSGRFFTPHVDMAKKYVGSGHLYYVDLPEDKEHWSWAAERPLPKEMAEAKVHDDENCPNCQLPHGLAARWLPQERVFGPTKETLDPRLFDGETLKPEVRHTILSMLDGCLSSHGLPDWQHWMRVFLAGSESTLWWGNNDFDTLLGCDYLALRRAHPEFAAMSIQGISDEFNTWFRAELNNEDWQAPWDVAEELWHITFYLNPMSWDIRQIKPYGAYSITDDTWVVRPPVLPEHKPEDFDASVYRLAESYADRIRRIIAAPPSPRRRGEADALWQFLHSDRGRAFGPRGHGYSDPGNLVWKYLDMHPDGLLTGLLEAREA